MVLAIIVKISAAHHDQIVIAVDLQPRTNCGLRSVTVFLLKKVVSALGLGILDPYLVNRKLIKNLKMYMQTEAQQRPVKPMSHPTQRISTMVTWTRPEPTVPAKA